MRRTKIVATIGPASESEDVLSQMIAAGMDIARFNTKHNVPEWHRERIARVRKVAQSLNKPVEILLDLQGPEIRIKLPNVPTFEMKKGEVATFIDDTQPPVDTNVILIPTEVIQGLQVGHKIILEDGKCEFTVTEKTDHTLQAEALDNFAVSTDKTMNTPNTKLNMPSILPKDISFIESLQKENIEYIGLSFVRDIDDISILRNELQERGMQSKVVSKIETQLALDNIHSIIDASDAIMVARGDLAVEIPYYQVPYWQKQIIKECNQKKKCVITATQMLLTMTTNPRPSRAEISDVANAVYDGSDAVMLSEETTTGKYPVKAVATQAEIVEYYEQFV